MAIDGNQTKLLFRLLEATSLRAEVIAGNIANQNTPGYVRQTVRFEDELRRSLADGGKGLGEVRPEVVDDRLTPGRPDGNNVALEIELNAMRENRILYESYSTILSGHFELLRSSITGGR
ncbi:MAG: flagellar basal body protein [Planctomycetota bacterium]